jgi:DNA-binding transcriptional LysR family regulator
MSAPNLDLDLVHCFLSVVESGGFTAAARRLHLTQSAVSLKVQRLESLLGHPVFVRTSRSVKLSAEGEIVEAYGRRLLATSREMMERVRGTAESGCLRLGVLHQFGQQRLPSLLAEFRRAHPKVSLEVEVGMTSELLALMDEGRYDMVIGAAGIAAPGTYAEEPLLAKEPVTWVRAAESVIDLRADPLPLVVFPAPCGFRRAALEALEKKGRTWRIVYSSASLSSIQAAVQADLGIGVLGKSSLLPGMRALGKASGLPVFPDLSIMLYRRNTTAGPLEATLASFLGAAVNRMRR